MEREIEVRKALAPNGKGTRWMKGYRGAKRAAKLLAEKEAAKRRQAPGWKDLPHPALYSILNRLSLADIRSLRESGLGGKEIWWQDTVRKIFLERRDALDKVQDVFVSVSSSRHPYRACPARDQFDPARFCQLEKVVVYVGDSRNDSGSPVVPDGIGEMRKLRSLTVSASAVIRSLPSSLSLCTELRTLCLYGHAFAEFPAVILTLNRLRSLDMSKCNLLKSLPSDIGDRLLELNKFDIRDCDLLKALPESLLRRMEEAAGTVSLPLRLSQSCFPGAYLQTVLCPEKYPRLHRCFFDS